MPGIITHYRALTESIDYIKKQKKKNSFMKSIEVLFNSEKFRKAGLFGAIGPNIFDYLPFQRYNKNGGSNISYELHSEKKNAFLKSMLNTILSYDDNNNEWSSTQRAYYYGIISHLITDSVFHPYIYYWSGFSNSQNKKDLFYFREQHLLFEYNLDLYFSKTDESGDYENKLLFNLGDMLPVIKHGRFQRIDTAVKNILLEAIKKACPDYYKKYNKIKTSDSINPVLSATIDMIPNFIKLSYKIKKSRNPKIIKLLNFIKRKNLIYSDFLINYPPTGRVNTHILNLHKERWFHPSGTSGLHYESVEDLMSSACKNITEIWIKTEEMLYKNIKDSKTMENEFKINSYTGLYNKGISSMNTQDPVRLRF